MYLKCVNLRLQVCNVCSAEKYTKRSSVLLLRLVYFSAEQSLPPTKILHDWIDFLATYKPMTLPLNTPQPSIVNVKFYPVQ